MKKILFCLLFLIVTMASFGQGSLRQGKAQLNAGVGFSSWGLPIYIGFDYGIHPDITFGAEFTYRSYRNKWHNHSYHHSVLGFAGNGNYHFNRILNIPSNFDFYAGLSLGFYIVSSPSDYEGDNISGLGLGAQVGGRYFITNRVGLNLEIGGGNTLSGGKFGVTIKF